MIIDITREQFRGAVETGIAAAGEELSAEFQAKLRKLADTAEFVGASFSSVDKRSGTCAKCPAREVGLHQRGVPIAENIPAWKFINPYDAALDRLIAQRCVAEDVMSGRGLSGNVLRITEGRQA